MEKNVIGKNVAQLRSYDRCGVVFAHTGHGLTYQSQSLLRYCCYSQNADPCSGTSVHQNRAHKNSTSYVVMLFILGCEITPSSATGDGTVHIIEAK